MKMGRTKRCFNPILYAICSTTAFIGLKLFFRLKVRGLENLPKNGGFILACNHESNLDPIVVGAVSFRKLSFMAKHDLFKNKAFGWLIKSLGAFPLVRERADKTALKEALRRLKAGSALLVFPGGSRGSEKVLPGVGFLAAKSEAPVVPAFIEGTKKIMSKGSRRIRFMPVNIVFGKQISLERRQPYADIAEKIMLGIKNLSCT